MTEQPDGDATPGASASPLLEALASFAGAVQDWARTNLPEPTGDADSDCQWCPLCQFASVLRGERPEVNEKLAGAGGAIVGALRSLLEPGAPFGHRPPGPDEPRVQHIDLGDPPGPDGGDGTDPAAGGDNADDQGSD